MNVGEATLPMQQLMRQVAAWAPRLALSLFLLVLGLVVAAIFSRVVRWLIRKTGIEAMMERFGISKLLYAIGVRRGFGHLMGTATWVAISLLALSGSAEILGLPGLADVTANVVAVLPRVLLAAGIAGVGFVVADVLRNVVRQAAQRDDGVESPEFAAQLVYWAVLVLSLTISLEQAGIETGLVNALVKIVIGGVVASVGLAFALGSRSVFRSFLARFYYERMVRPGDRIQVGDVAGVVVRYGPVAVLLRTDSGDEHVVPCAQLLEHSIQLSRGDAVSRRRAPPEK